MIFLVYFKLFNESIEMLYEEILNSEKLWQHQKDCIKSCVLYLNNFNIKSPTASLNRLPTGSGKSGIISILARTLEGYSNVLVLTPSITLRDQLFEDINSVFFESVLEIDNTNFAKKCIEFFLSTIESLLINKKKNDIVWIGTIQSLYEIYKENNKAYE